MMYLHAAHIAIAQQEMPTYGLWCVNCLLYSPIKETATSAKTAPTITGTNMITRLSDSSEGVVGVAAMTVWN